MLGDPLAILLIEDDPQDALLLRKLLAADGANPSALARVERLSEGLARLQEGSFDVVLLDLSLPDSQGVQTVTRLFEAHAEVPIVVLTGANDDALAVAAVKAGAQDYLVKGQFDARLLLRTLSYAIERHGLKLRVIEQMQEAREDEARLWRILDAQVDGCLVVDADGVVKFANPAAEKILARSRAEIIGRALGLPIVSGESSEINLVHPEKEVRVAEMRTVEALWEEGPAVLISLRDITQQKKLEEELIRAQRLRAVAGLAAGLSHNLNNILTAILGPAQLIGQKCTDPAILKNLEMIEESVARAVDIVDRLRLSVQHKDEDVLEAVSVDEIVEDVVQTSRPQWKDAPESRGVAIEMITKLGGVPPICGTEAELHDLLTNLVFNAVDAMPEGGRITIETKMSATNVQLIVSDTGRGMDEETRRRVFEPFFTTKMNVGAGLGLSTIHGAVQRWGGEAEVKSLPGAGTTFTFIFLVWQGIAASARKSERTCAESRPSRLLIVDSDAGVQKMLFALLSARQEVETFRDGWHALEQAKVAPYDVALINLELAGMAGDQIGRALRQMNPQIATVLITDCDLRETDPRRQHFDFQLRKPFTDLEAVKQVAKLAQQLNAERRERVWRH